VAATRTTGAADGADLCDFQFFAAVAITNELSVAVEGAGESNVVIRLEVEGDLSHCDEVIVTRFY